MNGCNRYREWHHSACRSAKCLIKRESRLEETVDTQRYKVFPQSWLVRWECAARTLGRRLAAAGLATSWTLQFWNPCEIGEIKSGKELSRETPPALAGGVGALGCAERRQGASLSTSHDTSRYGSQCKTPKASSSNYCGRAP
jgi:hypothetical protein